MEDKRNLRYALAFPYAEDFRPLRGRIISTLRENGLEPLPSYETASPGKSIEEVVQRTIERADFVIADLTGSNPNVMYEVGFAHALGKPVLPIVQRTAGRVPSDMAGYLYLVYDPAKPDELLHEIQDWTNRHVRERI